MMKTRTPILSKCIAVLLAVMLAFANVPGIMVTAFAAEHSVSEGEVMADYYELPETVEAILRSGYLAGDDAIEYDYPVDGDWVTVDHESKTITAKEKDGWVATDAHIVVDGAYVEDVALTDGEGVYTYDENAFSVRVCYDLVKEIDGQAEMFAAIEGLDNGYDNIELAFKADEYLGTIVAAMDTLEDLAEGIDVGFTVVQFEMATIAAVKGLRKQLNNNDGKLNLQVKNAEYDDASSKVQYLLESGKDYNSVLNDTYKKLKAIKDDGITNNDIVDAYLESERPSDYTLWKAFKNILNNAVTTMEEALAEEWYAAEMGTALVKADYVDYAHLDEMVKALEGTAIPETESFLTVTHYEANVNMNMKNVTVKVVLNVVTDEADSSELVEEASVTEVLTLSDGAAKAEIEAEAQSIIDAALEGWAEVYSAENFLPTYSELPETLTEDIEYVITYNPVDYTIDLGWADDMKVPYGYKYTLPKHENAEQAYDYYVDGVLYAQGQVVVILADTVIIREAGKSYVAGDLYAIVANNFGDDVAKAILTSGALFDDVKVSYRKPDPADAGSLLTLLDGVLTAQNYESDYENISWMPYTYGENGTENYFDGNTAEWDGKSVKVQYVLPLTNFGQAKAQEILDLAKELKAEAADQKSAMDSLAGLEDTLAQLDKTKLGALNGVIDVTDFSADPAENAEIKAELKAIVSAIIANNLEGNQLRILTMVVQYNSNGLRYYYQNYAAIKNEIDTLADYMSGLMDNEEALRIMCEAAGYGEYADKISDVEGQLNDYRARMSAPNAKIDVNSAKLGALVAALNMEGDADCTASDSPYVLSEMLTALDESQVNVQVVISTPAGNATVTTASMDRETVLTQNDIDTLKALVEAEVANLLGENKKYYVLETSADLDAMVGSPLSSAVTVYYNYTYKEYTVVIEGEADQIVTIADLEIDLPKHPDAGWTYKYTVDGVADIVSDTYTFTAEQLDRLFADGVYTITRTASNDAMEDIEGSTLDKWLVKDAEGKLTGVYAKVDGNKGGIMGFVMDFVNSGYSYIAINGQPLLYLAADNALEISAQTLVDALMNDNTFGSHTVINLGKNGRGEFLKAKMDLGNGEDDITFEGLDFTLYLNSVPSQMGTVAKGLEKLSPYMSFNSNNGVMDVELNLPEKVYEVYLAALLATGNVDKYTMNELNSEVAFQFLWDYIEVVKNSDADTATFTNTLAKVGIERDLTGAEDYYQLVKRALNNEGVVINPEDDNDLVDISVTGKSQKAINAIISLLGIDVSDYQLYLGMLREYKYDDAELSVAMSANLANTDKDFEAALVDVRHAVESKLDYLKKFDFTDNLPARAQSIAGEAAIILLGDVDGDLTFNDATIIDLNGYTINGNITANGKTLIFDSNLDTFDCGGVNGNLSGNLTIVGGKYTADVSAYIPEGYEVEDGVVRNILYTISNGVAESRNFFSAAKAINGEKVIFNVDTDIFNKDVASYTEAAAMIAADMAVDLVLNYFTAASLTADGYSIYNIKVEDIIGIYDSTNRKEQLINIALDFVDLADLNGFINATIDKMMDFAAIEEAVRADEEFISYDVVTEPWSVEVEHITSGDYLTFGVLPNADLAKEFTVGVRIEGSKKDYAANLAGGLSDIIVVGETDAQVEILRPSYSDKELTVSGEGSLVVSVDLTADQNTANAMSYTNDEYLEVLAIAFAYGLDNDAFVEAIGDDEALKAEIDKLTIADVFTALKAMNVPNRFAEMCAAVGYTSESNADRLESVYHLIAVAAGEALDVLDITGPAKTLGSLYNEATERYELTVARAADKSITKRGYTLTVGAEITELTLKVRLFDGECEHISDEGTVEKEASCTETGLKVYRCTKCGCILKEEVLPMIPHTEETVKGYAATCTETGLTDGVVCGVCGEVIVAQEVIPALGHTAGETVIENEVPATCTEDGSYDEVVYCTVCGEELSRTTVVVPALGHDYATEIGRQEATCCEEGWILYECSCGDQHTEVLPIDPDAHNWKLVGTTEPDCYHKGTETYECQNGCGETFTVEVGEMTEHNWTRWEVVRPATYTRTGLMRRYCTICGDVQERIIPMLVEDKEDEVNPGTGAPISAFGAIAVLAAAVIITKSKRG
ncbi:MAG: hypothetical protein E7479_00510 [Ruminococcaceae bacterium]|nr:hypothetical protein [Oscillospiraceae bacterium]